MAIQARDVEILHRYAQGVMDRAEHHAGDVSAVALALLGAIIWRGEPGSVEIKQYAGELANVLWVTINGTRYAFAYNHKDGAIEIRDRSVQGLVLHSFNNQTSVVEVETFFRSLGSNARLVA
jgi:Integron cassette protein VCH_CASS1 chain